MPALPLTPEHLDEKARLNKLFLKWQADRKDAKLENSQGFVANTYFGMSQPAFNQYLKGKAEKEGQRDGIPLNADFLAKICKVLGCNPEDISPRLAKEMHQMAGSIGYEMPANDPDYVEVDYQKDIKLSAGHGSFVFEWDNRKPLTFRRDFLSKYSKKPDQEICAFPIVGDSMVDKGFMDGGVALVSTKESDRHLKSGRIYALLMDNETYIKEVVKNDGNWIARSHNKGKNYEDKPLENGTIIIGRVFWACFEV